jgi:hypothetical protein
MYHREKRAAWKRMATAAWERSLALNPQQPRVQGYLASVVRLRRNIAMPTPDQI